MISSSLFFKSSFKNCKLLKSTFRCYSNIRVSENANVRHILLSNLRARNVLSLKTLEELNEAVSEIGSNVRCIVLRAEGKVFSAGHDIKELTVEAGKEYHVKVFDTCSKLMLEMRKSPVPILAGVNGVAAAAGCQLVAACDIVIASSNSSFITPGADAGIFCSTPGVPLVRSVPLKVAADMLLTGLPITAQQAYNIGLISAVVPENKLDEEIELRVNAILRKSRAVLSIGKKFMYKQLEMTAEAAYREGGLVMVSNVNMKDGQEGISSFIQKRKPNWSHED